MATPDWDHYRSMLAVMDTGSLSGAARVLDLSQPTVGRHIEALETALEAPLFTRSATGLNPTRLALALEPHARAMAAAAETLARTAAGDPDSARGVVRVTASEIVAVEVLPEILTQFRRAHPLIDIELVASNRQEDLLRRDADVAIRMVRPTQDALLARRIGEVRISFFAHRDYIAQFGAPEGIDDLGRHTVIGFDRGQLIPSARAAVNIEITPELFALRTDSDIAQIAALRAGFGICGLQEPLAARDPNLVPVLQEQISFPLEVWVVMHEDLRADRRARLMFDHLVESMTAYLRSGC
ncbi:MAG TPA: LysR family transcriptional regulator [Caulobacteraceae bacterium]|jgi:DNA-binding transcriptional LysR family regulator|nr:LysR family transcriptional regulator [Caulobacteraceae bacterium]